MRFTGFINTTCPDLAWRADVPLQLKWNQFVPRLTAYRCQISPAALWRYSCWQFTRFKKTGLKDIICCALPSQGPVRLAGRITAQGPGRRLPCCCVPGCPASPGRSGNITRTEESEGRTRGPLKGEWPVQESRHHHGRGPWLIWQLQGLIDYAAHAHTCTHARTHSSENWLFCYILLFLDEKCTDQSYV